MTLSIAAQRNPVPTVAVMKGQMMYSPDPTPRPARMTLGPSTLCRGSGSGMSRYGIGGRLPLRDGVEECRGIGSRVTCLLGDHGAILVQLRPATTRITPKQQPRTPRHGPRHTDTWTSYHDRSRAPTTRRAGIRAARGLHGRAICWTSCAGASWSCSTRKAIARGTSSRPKSTPAVSPIWSTRATSSAARSCCRICSRACGTSSVRTSS